MTDRRPCCLRRFIEGSPKGSAAKGLKFDMGIVFECQEVKNHFPDIGSADLFICGALEFDERLPSESDEDEDNGDHSGG